MVSPEPIVPKEKRDPRAPIDTRELFQARGAMAQSVLNILELVRHVYRPLAARVHCYYFFQIVENNILPEHQSKLRRCIIKMAVCSKCLPKSLFLDREHLDLSEATRVAAGVTVYRAKYQGKVVAMKHVPYVTQRNETKWFNVEYNARLRRVLLFVLYSRSE